jgi:hypothetical protein
VTDSRIKTGDHITCTISSLNITDDIIICQVAAINDGEFTVILSNCPDVPGYKVNWVVNI